MSDIAALRAEAKANLDLAERHMNEKHRLRAELAALRAENKRLKVENIQMQAALGYAIMAEDERYILPLNPFKCGTCDASKHLRAEVERLRKLLWKVNEECPEHVPIYLLDEIRAALEETNHE